MGTEVAGLDDTRWWHPDSAANRYQHVLNVVRAIRRRQIAHRQRDLLHASLYGNTPMLGFSPSSHTRVVDDGSTDALVLNLIKPKVDTWVSMICRSRPEPMFLPTGADPTEMWSLRKQCKGLERWSEGKLEEAKFFDNVAPLAVLDVGIFDYGVAKVSICGVDGEDWDKADVEIERAPAFSMVVDEAECLSGRPRNLFQRQWVDRFVLIARFPSLKSEILACPQKSTDEDELGEWGFNEYCDQVLVTEAWHLPSKEGAGDGRHTMVIANVALFDEAYEESAFPFAFLRQMPAPWGIRGISIAQQLRPLQIFINQQLNDYQDGLSTMSRGKWLIPRQAEIEQGHIDDQIGTGLYYNHPFKPEAWTPQSLSPDGVPFTWQIWEKADEIIGISAMRSSGLVQNNLKSGEAIHEANDQQDGRFLVSSRLFEAWVMEVVALSIDRARVIAKRNGKYATRYSHGEQVEMISFKDVDLKRDQYTLKCYPASALANSPGARYDQLNEMLEKGAIDMATFRHLLGFPDLDGAFKILNAPQELADKLIERFLDADDTEDPAVYIAPEPSWPLQTLYEKFLYAAANAQVDDMPDANIGLLRRFMQQLEYEASKAGISLPGMPPPGAGPNATMQQPAPGGGPPMMAPPGAGPPGVPPPGAPPQPMAA